MRLNSLDVFFNPETVAVIGASRTAGKVGNIIFSNFLESNFKGKVYPVNPNAGEVYGKLAYPSIKNVPGNVDLAVIAVKAEITPQVMRECCEKKVRGAIIVSGGFAEIGEEGRKRQDEVASLAKATGIRVIGPNCIGVYDSETEMDTMFLPKYRMTRPRRGRIAFISQSGAFGVAVLDWAASRGFGVSKFISLGNRMDVNEIECLEYLVEDEDTRVIALYIESTVDGRRLITSAKKVVANKPTIVLKTGTTPEGARAVLSHTGSLAGSDRVYDSSFRQAGMIRAYGPQDLFDVARSLAYQPLPQGDRVAIVTNGGGFGVMTTDALIEGGLRLAELSDKTKDLLKSRLPGIVSTHNPVDLVGDSNAERYRVALNAVLDDEGVDGVIVIILFQTPSLQSDVVGVITEASDRREKPVLVCTAGGDFAEVHTRMLERAGVPVYPSPGRASRAMATLYRYSQILKQKRR